MDPLQIVPEKDINKLIQMLEDDLPQSLHAYSYLKTLIEWKRKKPSIESYILAPDGDFSDATFMLYSVSKGYLCGTVFSMSEEGYGRLEKALVRSERLPWSQFLFTCLSPSATAMLKRLLNAKIGPHNYKYTYGQAMWLPAHEAALINPTIPDDVYIGEVGVEHSKQINDVWPHRSPGSEQEVSQMISLNFGVGLFSKETDGLISWVLHSFYGGLGLAQTEESHQRKGYATLVVQEMARRLGSSGIDVHLNVVEGNTAGMNFFNKLGFRPMFRACWIYQGSL